MSTIRPTRTDTPSEYRDRLCETTGIDYMQWKRLWGGINALAIGVMGYVAIQLGADPLYMGGLTLILATAAFVGQVKEIEIANVATLTYRNGNPPEDDE